MALLFTAGVMFLAASLYHVQIVEFSSFSRDQMRQSIRRVQVPGPRGRILDRNGVCLADNRPSYCIAFYVEELRKRGKWSKTIDAVDADIDRLAGVLGIPREISKETVASHVMQRLPMPLLAWRDVGQETLARWAERAQDFPGVDVYVQPERFYPQGTLASHAIGYVSRDRPEMQPGERVHFYLPEMVGRAGLERQYNALLTGVSGDQLIRVDARGYKNAEWEGAPEVPGRDLRLTLDVTIQRALEKAMRGWRGAGVVVDPRDGEILAMASSPTYDPNQLVPAPTAGVWNRLNSDPTLPLLNRAIQGRYAPGSTFKPVTAMAALLHPGFDPNETYPCNGVFVMGSMRLHCWNTYGHGAIALRKAIEQSCNVYFCHLGQTIGYDAIYEQARKVGLGVATGIDLPYEARGLLPTAEWKLKTTKEPWRTGDTCHISIGQGMLVTTPLQMAMLVSVFANGGMLFRPHVSQRGGAVDCVREMDWPPAALQLVRNGMHDVATVGTGRRVQVRGLDVAAKTGTAEYEAAGGIRRKNTWVTAFAPFDHPTVAVAIVIENGESGGHTVAPMVHDVLVSVFGESSAETEDASETKAPAHAPGNAETGSD